MEEGLERQDKEVGGQGGAVWVVYRRLALDQGEKEWTGEAVRKHLVVGSGGGFPGGVGVRGAAGHSRWSLKGESGLANSAGTAREVASR